MVDIFTQLFLRLDIGSIMRRARACVCVCRGCGLSSRNTPIKRQAGAWSRELGRERERERSGRRVAPALKPARASRFSHSSRAAREGRARVGDSCASAAAVFLDFIKMLFSQVSTGTTRFIS